MVGKSLAVVVTGNRRHHFEGERNLILRHSATHWDKDNDEELQPINARAETAPLMSEKFSACG